VGFNLAIQPTYEEMIDKEWIVLMLVAKTIGLTPQEVRDFLHGALQNKSN
jgi:hypothetical protein